MHPMIKNYDELTRALNRTQKHLDMYGPTLDEVEKHKTEKVIEYTKKALDYIPNEYRVSRKALKNMK